MNCHHICRLPFAVLAASALPVSSSNKADIGTLFLLTAAISESYYVFNIEDGSYKEILLDLMTMGPKCLAEAVSVCSDSDQPCERMNDMEARKMLRSNAVLVVHPFLQRERLAGISSCDVSVPAEKSCVYLVRRSPTSGGQDTLHRLSVYSTSLTTDVSVWEGLVLRSVTTTPLSLPSRIVGIAYSTTTGVLSVIGESKQIISYSTIGDSHLALIGEPDEVNFVSSLPRLLDYHNAIVFVIHKPLGVLSSAVDYESAPRGTVYESAAQAGFPVNLGLVGRLDGDTSGIMVFTNDGRLNDRILHPLKEERQGEEEGENVASNVARIVTSTEVESPLSSESQSQPNSVVSFCPPDESCLSYQHLKKKEYVLTLLQGKNKYCLVDGVFDTAKFEEDFGMPMVFNRSNTEYNVKEASIKVIRRYQHPDYNKHNRADMGWVIEVLVDIQEGKHKQIRRLAKRAGYITVALERRTICGGLLRLESVPQPGQCRWLTAEEKYTLYRGFQLI